MFTSFNKPIKLSLSLPAYLLLLFDTRVSFCVLCRPLGGLPLSQCFCKCSCYFILYILVVFVLQQSFRETCNCICIVMKCLCGCLLVIFVRIFISLDSIFLILTSFTRKQSLMMSFSDGFHTCLPTCCFSSQLQCLLFL